MVKSKKKRVNPNKVSLSKDEIDEEKMMIEASKGNMYYAWLLLLPTLAEEPGMTRKQIVEIWDAVNEYASQLRPANLNASEETKRAEHLMGLHMPHPYIDLDHIRTKGDLLAAKRKLKEDALHSALCIICLGLEGMHRFSHDEIGRLFFNADITLAEIQSGNRSYAQIAEELREKRIILQDSNEDMLIVDEDEEQEQEDSATPIELWRNVMNYHDQKWPK